MEIEFETIHVTTLAITALCIIYADHLGFQYFRGTRARLSSVVTTRLHYAVWAGLLGMITSGAFLVAPMWEYFKYEPVFYVKMMFVGVLVCNAWVIGRMAHVSCERTFAELTQRERTILTVSGAVSGMGWLGAACIGAFFL